MSLWNDNTPPVLYPDAVATPAGWADPITGELYVTVTGLSTYKTGASGIVSVGLIGNKKSQFTTSQSLGNATIFAAGEYMVLEVVFSEPVTFSGTPTITATINGNARTFTYFQDTTDLLEATSNKVCNITIGSGGSHYLVGDKLTFTGGLATDSFSNVIGNPAQAVVSSVGGSNAITGITILDSGSGYTSAPTVGVSTGYVQSVTVSGSGTGYVNGDALTFTGGGGSGAAGYVVVDASGNVTRAVVTNAGSGYTSAPTVSRATAGSGNTFTGVTSFGSSASLTATLGTPANGKGTNRLFFRYQVASNETATSAQISFASPISGGSSWLNVDSGLGSGAAGTAVLASGVTSFTVTNAGSGYTSAPTVTVSGDGTGATAVAVLDQKVASVAGVIAGVGYRSAPTVTVGAGNATVTAVLGTAGIITDVTFSGTGTAFVNGAALIVNNTGTGGTGFAGTIAASGGAITGVTITNAGSGYNTAPTLSTAAGSGQTLTAVVGFPIASYTVGGTNTGYTVAPTLSVAAPTATAGTTTAGGGVVLRTTATATATLGNLQTVKFVNVVDAGSGYSAATVAFSGGGGTSAAATAAVSGEISGVTITAPGTQYWVAPTLSFTNHAGDTTGENAAGTVKVGRGRVLSVTMTDNGDSYTGVPSVTFTPVAEVPTLTFTNTFNVIGASISGTGTGYEAGLPLIFSSGTAAGQIVTDSSGNITGVVITNGGAYAAGTVPTVTITAPATYSGSTFYQIGQVVISSGVRYVSIVANNWNNTPGSSPSQWTALTDQTLTALVGSDIVGTCTVDGVAPTITAASVLFDQFGDATTQVAFVTGNFFTVRLTFSSPVVYNGLGVAKILVTLNSMTNDSAVYFAGSGTNQLYFTYEVQSVDSATAGNVAVATSVTLTGSANITDLAGNSFVNSFSAPSTSTVTFN